MISYLADITFTWIWWTIP